MHQKTSMREQHGNKFQFITVKVDQKCAYLDVKENGLSSNETKISTARSFKINQLNLDEN